jgi:triphosphoribosyl-dephospho-CoA synthase
VSTELGTGRRTDVIAEQDRDALAASAATVTEAELQRIGRSAVVALYDELALAPKPGLVSFADSGSHSDMDAQTFFRSLFALRHFFARIAVLGADGAAFAELETAGIAAEARMLQATGGVNCHRGAIFSLGLLCAAAGFLVGRLQPLTATAIRSALVEQWGEALVERQDLTTSTSHGARAARRFGLRGAASEAALGFPVLFEFTLPALQAGLRAGLPPRLARIDALFHTIAELADTNLAHRAGLAGLHHAQQAASDFLRHGGAGQSDGLARAQAIHRDFVALRLSPGGSADLLAAACWLQRVGGES